MRSILTLVIVIGIVYMIFEKNASIKSALISSMTVGVDQPVTPEEVPEKSPENKEKKEEVTEEFTGSFMEKTISHVMVNLLKTDQGKKAFGNLITPVGMSSERGKTETFKVSNLNNMVEAIFEISTFGAGDKGPASCGHIVTANYQILSKDNLLIKEATDTFPLGSDKIIPGLDAVIVGMKTQQTRKATISKKLLQEIGLVSLDSKLKMEDIVKVSVTLKDIISHNFVNNQDVRMFDDEISYKLPLVCGNKTSYNAKITRLRDSVIMYDSKQTGKKINMQIGDLNYPIIFSASLHGKIPSGSRTVIAKGKLFKSYATKNSIIFPNIELPENEYFMLDLADFK